MEEEGGGDGGGDGGVGAGTEGEVDAVVGELAGLLGLAAEAVEYPWLARTQLAAEGQELVDGAYAVDYQRFAKALGQLDLAAEDGCLHR